MATPLITRFLIGKRPLTYFLLRGNSQRAHLNPKRKAVKPVREVAHDNSLAAVGIPGPR